jgi:hypothetical protein
MSSLLSLVSSQDRIKPKKPRRTTKPTAPPSQEQLPTEKRNYSPPVEGFTTTNRNFPLYAGPSLFFNRSTLDTYYDGYKDTNLLPNPDLLSLVESMDVAPPDLPNYGALLSNFDAGSISSIPWDADNATSLKSDIVWGHVTPDASKSIFIRAYHENLLSDPANMSEDESNVLYRSALFSINASSPGDAALLQAADAVGQVVGQSMITAASEKVENIWKVAAGKQMISRLETARAARISSLTSQGLASKISTDSTLASLDNEIKSVRDAGTEFRQAQANAISAKEAAAKALTNEEQLIKAMATAEKVKKGEAIAADGIKATKKVGIMAKFKGGINKAKTLIKNLATAFNRILKNALSKFATRFATQRAIIWATLGLMNAALSAASVFTFGLLAPLLAIVTVITTAYGILDAVCQVLSILLLILLPSLLDKALANGGVCASGKPIDQIISDDFLYFLFVTFVPIGGLVDAFGPYVCYESNGTPHMKQPLYIPAYFADSTLSLYKHNYKPSEEPRGDSTRYESAVPKGWKITAGIARAPCPEGTWTSSDVDMLCNISTYVPRTYVKKTSVPATVVKGSHIPRTYGQSSYIAWVYNQTPRNITSYKYSSCPGGWSDWGGTCWQPWSQGAGSKGPIERQYCPDGYDDFMLMCRSNCPPGTSYLIRTDLFCRRNRDVENEDDAAVFYIGKTNKWCNANKGNRSGSNWKIVAGVCWSGCDPGDTDIGLLCRSACRAGSRDVAGVCWDDCPPNSKDIGALCRYNCPSDAPSDVAGVCWGKCNGNDIDVGALCRERCKSGYHEVAGCCWGDIGTFARASMIPRSTKIYDPGYNPTRDLPNVTIPYCNFSSPTMLDRMAQFYYDQSTLNPQILSDGRISYEYIIQFYGVIASSELSCDVACQIKTVVFDPVTGDNYEESVGTTYPDDPGNEVSYRRFYFINIDSASAAILSSNAAANPTLYTKQWPADPQGIFTVTGCTNSDYTALCAQIKSTDPGVDPIISLPKVFNVTDKKGGGGPSFSLSAFATSAASTAVTVALGYRPSVSKGFKQVSSTTGQVLAAAGGGLAGQSLSNTLNSALGVPNPVGISAENTVVGPVSGSVADGTAVFSVVTNNDNYSIDHGPIYEVRARDSTGYVPSITFCGKVNTTALLCSNEKILRDTIEAYHMNNPTVHIKTVTLIEPRGKDGCYYGVSTVPYDASTNTEGTIQTASEFIRKYVQDDQSTCVFSTTNTFTTDMGQYPIRSYYDVVSGETVYPTRKINSTATVQARYVRMRPSQTGDGYLRISQIAVYDSTGKNLALKRPVYSSVGTVTGFGPPNLIVDGTYASRSGTENVWSGGTNLQTTYIDIDLGQTFLISHVVFYGQLDIATPANDQGMRIELLTSNTSTATPQKQLLLGTSNRIEKVDFSTKMLLPNLPVKPFQVPRPLPPETNIGSGCANRCQDKNQIDAMLKSYNSSNTTSQIMKVTKAFTPNSTRCDYEVEMVRTNGTTKTVGKETLIMKPTLASTSNSGTILYGRVVRIIDAPFIAGGSTAPLLLSQVAIINSQGVNIAIGQKTYATVNNTVSLNKGKNSSSSILTDGILKERSAPYYWSSDNYVGMSIDVDLGINRDIASVTIYGVAGNDYKGVTVQILASVDKNATPLYSTTLEAGKSTFTLSNFPTCTFTYEAITSPFSYIQDTTPPLSSIDTSGGVLFFKGITDSIVGLYNTMVNSVSSVNPLKILSKDINSANTAVSNIVTSAAAAIQISGCPNTKCSDPAILQSIANSYNSSNSAANTQYGAETNVMTQISKAGVSGQNTCDVMFTNLYNFYDDYLYPPTSSQNTTMVKRFTMTNTGNCALQVAAGSSTIDLSSNALGIIPPSSTVSPPFTITPCQVNCRDPSLLASIKAKINSIVPADGTIPNFTTVLQSFASGPNTCEYFMRKDVTRKNRTTLKTTTARGIETYVTANFSMNMSKCSFTLDSVGELDPEFVTTSMDSITGVETAYINGIVVNLPYLFNYDNTTPSTQVNETPLNL